ncbi:hypothetical protein [Mycolicibacterium grossiae]|uniref:hypothetical protein n=1 Tax=Mycolicibacterium grossiae TaxID=1552759 RepID=UPI000F7727AD|nr:hypothetical protein [Mycolicibacterium grossiae]QEM47172.1 hypothetical protein FZ046_22490 [Mycolicibacterium grossiae]
MTLTRTIEPSETDFTALPGVEQWVVSWTVAGRREDNHLRQPHCSEKAARRHIDGLLKRRPPGMPVERVYVEKL